MEAKNLREINELLGVEQGTGLQELVSGRYSDSWGTMPIPQALDAERFWNYPAPSTLPKLMNIPVINWPFQRNSYLPHSNSQFPREEFPRTYLTGT